MVLYFSYVAVIAMLQMKISSLLFLYVKLLEWKECSYGFAHLAVPSSLTVTPYFCHLLYSWSRRSRRWGRRVEEWWPATMRPSFAWILEVEGVSHRLQYFLWFPFCEEERSWENEHSVFGEHLACAAALVRMSTGMWLRPVVGAVARSPVKGVKIWF